MIISVKKLHFRRLYTTLITDFTIKSLVGVLAMLFNI